MYIDIYLITGFLGSGKTTLLQNILNDNNNERIGLIINEYGKINIDGQLIVNSNIIKKDLTNGSVFCACLKGNFVDTLIEYLSLPIDRLYIEASGMADPFSMNKLFEELGPILDEHPEITRRYRYKGSICVVDAVRFNTLSEVLVAPVNQIIKSNLALVNKIDCISPEQLSKVCDKILNLHPDIKLFPTTFCKIDLDEIKKTLTGEVAEVSDTSNTCGNRPYAIVLRIPFKVDRETLNLFLRDISEKFIRMKGFFKDNHGDDYLVSTVYDSFSYEKIEYTDGIVYKIMLISMDTDDLTDWLTGIWKKYFKRLLLLEEC